METTTENANQRVIDITNECLSLIHKRLDDVDDGMSRLLLCGRAVNLIYACHFNMILKNSEEVLKKLEVKP